MPERAEDDFIEIEGVGRVLFREMPPDLHRSLTIIGDFACRICGRHGTTTVLSRGSVNYICCPDCRQSAKAGEALKKLLDAIQAAREFNRGKWLEGKLCE